MTKDLIARAKEALEGYSDEDIDRVLMLKFARALIREREEKQALQDRIENAMQAMSETQPSWEYRCHAIMAALGCDYGGPTPDIPEEHTWYARNLALYKARAEKAEDTLAAYRAAQKGQSDE